MVPRQTDLIRTMVGTVAVAALPTTIAGALRQIVELLRPIAAIARHMVCMNPVLDLTVMVIEMIVTVRVVVVDIGEVAMIIDNVPLLPGANQAQVLLVACNQSFLNGMILCRKIISKFSAELSLLEALMVPKPS
jgi:predicted membrane protein